MQRIVAPLEASDTGPMIVDLQDALLAIVAHSSSRGGEVPHLPVTDEMTSLIERVRDERAHQVFGKATQALAQILQVQHGLGDGLGGVVEHRTAAVFNELLKAFETRETQKVGIHPLAPIRPDKWVELDYGQGVPGGSLIDDYVGELAADSGAPSSTVAVAVESASDRRLRPGRWAWWRNLRFWRGAGKR